MQSIFNETNAQTDPIDPSIDPKISQILQEITSLKHQSSMTACLALLSIIIFILILNTLLIIYAIYTIHKTKYNLIDFFQNYFRFHSQVLRYLFSVV